MLINRLPLAAISVARPSPLKDADLPVFYFHVSGLKAVVDTNGIELADESAAWREAVKLYSQLLYDIDGRVPDRSEIVMRVADEQGKHVATFRFIGQRETDVILADVAERIAEEVDQALDWIADVYRPASFNDYAHTIGLAAVKALQEGDALGRGLVVRRETKA